MGVGNLKKDEIQGLYVRLGSQLLALSCMIALVGKSVGWIQTIILLI